MITLTAILNKKGTPLYFIPGIRKLIFLDVAPPTKRKHQQIGKSLLPTSLKILSRFLRGSATKVLWNGVNAKLPYTILQTYAHVCRFVRRLITL